MRSGSYFVDRVTEFAEQPGYLNSGHWEQGQVG